MKKKSNKPVEVNLVMSRAEIGALFDPCDLSTLRERVLELAGRLGAPDNYGWVQKASRRQLNAEIAWLLSRATLAKAPVEPETELAAA
jgi:DNA-binding PucR family transcriptional regulator